MSKHRGLSGQLIEGGELEAWEAALVDLLVGELIEQKPDDTRMSRRRSELRLVKGGRGVEVTGLPTTPDQLPEDEQAGERKNAKGGGGNVLDFFKARKKFLPEERDRDKGDEAEAGD